MPDLQPEDAKLVTLARSARGRTGAPEGAAVRDLTAGVPVHLAGPDGAVRTTTPA